MIYKEKCAQLIAIKIGKKKKKNPQHLIVIKFRCNFIDKLFIQLRKLPLIYLLAYLYVRAC